MNQTVSTDRTTRHSATRARERPRASGMDVSVFATIDARSGDGGDARATPRALAVVDDRADATDARRARGATMTRVGALWSMTQVYAMLLVVVVGYNATASAFRGRRLDLSPEGMMLAGGVDPATVARYNATHGAVYGYGGNSQKTSAVATRWRHVTRYAIRGSFNAAAGAAVGAVSQSARLARGSVRLLVPALERLGLGAVVDAVAMVSSTATSSVRNMVWLVMFASTPVVDFTLLPLYDFILDGLEPLYQTFFTGTMDFFEDMTFNLEQNLATVLDARLLSVIRRPMRIFLNPFKWPRGLYDAFIRPAYEFCAYPELFDALDEPVRPIVKRTYGDRCRASAWGDWTKCSMQCGSGFRVRVNHCGKKQYERCVGAGVVGCDGVCDSGLRTDCNGMCGGKALLDKCAVCGGNNAAIGCDGKCFSGMREDTIGNCCHAATITASGMCGEGDNLPAHLKAAAAAARAKATSTKKNVPLLRRFINFLKATLRFALKVFLAFLRVIAFAIRFVLTTVTFTLNTLFSSATLKLVGTLTACYMAIGIVDKKAQKNVGQFIREVVPFMDEDAKDGSRVVGAFPNAKAAKTPKEKIEAFVRDLIESFKRAGDVPGSIAHYLSWLCKRLYGVIVFASPFILQFLRDASYENVASAQARMAKEHEEAENIRRQNEELARRVEQEARADEERERLMSEAAKVREEAAKAEREAAEREQARQEEMARLTEAEAQAKAQLEEERNRAAKVLEQELAEAKARLAEEEARLKEEAERIKREAALKEAEVERERQAERERLAREEAELKARLAEESTRESEALKARLAELEERMKERGDVIKRLEAADVEVKKAELVQMTNRATSAAVRLETAENELEIMAKRIITFEKANIGKRYALQSKRAMADAKEYCGLLSDFFVRKDEHVSAEEELSIITKYRDLSNDAPAALVARLEDASEVPIEISKRFTFLLKYRARRNAVVVLSKLSASHPEDAVRRKCFAALNKITRSSTFGLLVVARCAALPRALMAMVEWANLGDEQTTEDNAPWEAMELVHNLVSSRRMKRSEVLRRHLAGGLFGRCILAVVKLVPHIPSFQGMLLGTLWQLMRASGYDATLQNDLVADGIIRHILDCKTYAKQNSEVARVFCGCALALAMKNEAVQKQMADKKVAMPARIVSILSLHQGIDYKGEFTSLNHWLS
ncbi:hypothetical protein N9D08_00705 [bacterium]|nr:hypothetical protein [bacterium]